MAATQAFREMLVKGLDVASIQSVEISIPPPFLRMVDHGIADGDRMPRLTSLPYQIAIAALTPDAAYDSAQVGEVPAAVRDLMAKVKVTPDERLMANYPEHWPAHVVVDAGGTLHEHAVTLVPGDPALPFELPDVREKFHRFCDRTIGEKAVDELIADTQAVLSGGKSPRQLLGSIEHACA
jgi:2-methylcitrate dehydratase PrpD